MRDAHFLDDALAAFQVTLAGFCQDQAARSALIYQSASAITTVALSSIERPPKGSLFGYTECLVLVTVLILDDKPE